MTEDVVDGEIVEEDEDIEQGGGAVVPAGNSQALSIAPQASPEELVTRLEAIRKTQELAMDEGTDYGVIPGTGSKPTLLKSGAEKLSVLFQLDLQIRNQRRWEPDGHLTVVSRATVYHAPSGARLGYGEGACSTHERKYAYRKAERKCPNCGEAAVIKGKQEYGGGWLCWSKKGGCNSKWEDGDQAIEGQEIGDVDNPDLADLWNTVIKMAAKRARVDAVLSVTGASALFTQDVEDLGRAPDDDEPPERQVDNGQQGGGQNQGQQQGQRKQQGQQKSAPQTKAQGKQTSGKPISGQQKGKINALLGKGEATRAQASAIRRWWASKVKQSHFDRLPQKSASELIDALGEDGSGVETILQEIFNEAEGGNNVAQKLAMEIAEDEEAQAAIAEDESSQESEEAQNA